MPYAPRRTRLIGMLVAIALLWAGSATAAELVTMTAAVERIFSGETPQSVTELRAMQDHLQQLAKKLTPCTVGVRVGPAQGSGVIISPDGYVLTAAHVVGKPNTEVTFVLHDGRTVKGKTLGMNRTIDAGLMKISEGNAWPHVELGDSSKLKEGQWCVVMGHPGGYERGREPVVRFGRVLQNESTVITTDCTLVGGDSGGPLFDMRGRVIGINSRIAGPLNANMHVPVNTFRDTWDRLAKAEAWGSMLGQGPYLGVQGATDSAEARIARVYPETPAAQAGLKAGDVVLKFDGRDVRNFASLSEMVAEKEPGDKVKLRVLRGKDVVELQVTLAKRQG